LPETPTLVRRYGRSFACALRSRPSCASLVASVRNASAVSSARAATSVGQPAGGGLLGPSRRHREREPGSMPNRSATSASVTRTRVFTKSVACLNVNRCRLTMRVGISRKENDRDRIRNVTSLRKGGARLGHQSPGIAVQGISRQRLPTRRVAREFFRREVSAVYRPLMGPTVEQLRPANVRLFTSGSKSLIIPRLTSCRSCIISGHETPYEALLQAVAWSLARLCILSGLPPYTSSAPIGAARHRLWNSAKP